MATINLGSIKFKWQGAYAGGTAYTVDDVVSYNGSSYICILASTGNLPTNATYWEQMSSAGTNGTDGTDLTSTLTTQGDILYRDGSGLQKLGAGTSGQVLQTGGTGANPSWGTVSSDFVKLGEVEHSSDVSSFSVDGYHDGTNYDIYEYIVDKVGVSATGNQLRLQYIMNNTAITSGYYYVTDTTSINTTNGTIGVDNYGGVNTSNVDTANGWNWSTLANDHSGQVVFRVFNAHYGKKVNVMGTTGFWHYSTSPLITSRFMSSLNSNATDTCTGIKFLLSSGGNFSNYRVKIYGIK